MEARRKQHGRLREESGPSILAPEQLDSASGLSTSQPLTHILRRVHWSTIQPGREGGGAGEVARWVKCWLCKHKDPSLTPRTDLQRPDVVPQACVPPYREAETGQYLRLSDQPCRWDGWTSSQSENPILENKVDELVPEDNIQD